MLKLNFGSVNPEGNAELISHIAISLKGYQSMSPVCFSPVIQSFITSQAAN